MELYDSDFNMRKRFYEESKFQSLKKEQRTHPEKRRWFIAVEQLKQRLIACIKQSLGLLR